MIDGLEPGQLGLLVAVTVASAVEFVEAFTIVLAMGLTRGWRSALAGTLVAIVALTITTVVAGVALIQWFPESLLKLLVGGLLLIFGLQWLRKAILRSAGRKALHDEATIFAAEAAAGRAAGAGNPGGIDGFGFAVTFKGVFLEGLEVVFIVLTFGTSAGDLPLAIAGAVIGGAFVLVLGIAVHRPLSRVPENTLKHGVGLLLATFGTFWSIEGLETFAPGPDAIEWPGGELSLVVVLVAWFAVSQLLIARQSRRAAPTPAT